MKKRRRKTGTRRRQGFWSQLGARLWSLLLWILALLACATLVPELIWLYLYWRHQRLYRAFEKVGLRLQRAAEQCPSPMRLDIIEQFYLKLLHLLQANNLLRGVVDLRLGSVEKNNHRAAEMAPREEDLHQCIVQHKGSYAFPTKLSGPPRGIAYPMPLLRSAFELREEEFSQFRGVTRLAEIVEGGADFPELPDRTVQNALRDIVVNQDYFRASPTLRDRLVFEIRYFVPYDFHESPPLIGVIRGFFLRPLRHRPYITRSYFRAKKQLRYWRACLKMLETFGDFSRAASVFWKRRRRWQQFSRDPLWGDALANLINWLCYEQTKSLFFSRVHDELTGSMGGQRIALWFPFSIVELQKQIDSVPGYALEPKEMVRLAKKLSRCARSVEKHRRKKLTFGRRLLIRVSSLRMYGLRRSYRKMALKAGR
ncbi:MAG: hypothetical protein HOC74_00500 [Gemmatimonadetes bacterium]|jgi:hypothetical protein|nr:hypothetical protein [Gemmatimonadota bacterium]